MSCGKRESRQSQCYLCASLLLRSGGVSEFYSMREVSQAEQRTFISVLVSFFYIYFDLWLLDTYFQ
jgi:hypothetical protein